MITITFNYLILRWMLRMHKKNLDSCEDDKGVSPVIGVILMVAITVMMSLLFLHGLQELKRLLILPLSDWISHAIVMIFL